MSKVYTDVLTGVQKKEFPRLVQFSHLGVMVGGTALALQLQHRRSYDFDIFLSKPLPKNLFKKVKKIFGLVKTIRRNQEELTFATSSGLKITFFEYPFKSLYPSVDAGPIKIADWRDIALDKSHTIGRRALYRDYVDLFCIIKAKKITLDWLIKNTTKKFGDWFTEKLFLEQLVYLDDLDIVSIEFLKDSYTAEEIKSYFEKITADYTKEKIR